MREQLFQTLKTILQANEEMEIVITEIQMELDNKSHNIEEQLDELFTLTQRIQNEEKNIYHDYLQHNIERSEHNVK